MTDLPRLTVAPTFDHDSISAGVRRGDSPVKLSHAEFGVRVGASRILALVAERQIPSTWFVPGHTLERELQARHGHSPLSRFSWGERIGRGLALPTPNRTRIR